MSGLGTIVAHSQSSSPNGLGDELWGGTGPIRLIDARSGLEPVLATEVRLVEATGVLWGRFTCEATDIRATMSRYKDKVWTEGAVEIYLRRGDRGPLFEFQVSPIGTCRDLRVLDPGQANQVFDDSWSSHGLVTEARIRRDDEGDVCGWDAMFGIPLESMEPLDRQPDRGSWKLGAFRLEYQPEEFSALRSHAHSDPHSADFLCDLQFSAADEGTR